MGKPDYLACHLWNLYTGQEATVRTRHGTTNWFQIGKGVHQGCILSPWLFNLYAEYFIWNSGLDEGQAGIKITGRNVNNLRYTEDTTLMAEINELKGPLDKSETGEWNSWLKAQPSENQDHGIWSRHFMENRWGNSGNNDRHFLGRGASKITAGDDCNHEIKIRLLLGRKAMTNLDSILKSRDITLPTRIHLIKAMVFPVVMCGCDSWSIKKAGHWRIDAFEMWW